METMNFELVAPEATIISGQVSQIDIPGTEGDFGVLPGHCNLISTLHRGIVKIYTGKDEIKRVLVSGGVAEVNATSCTILSERVMSLDSVTRADAEKSHAKAREALEKAVDETTKFHANQEVDFMEALISTLS